MQRARLLTQATSHTYLAGPERLWSHLKVSVARHRRMVEWILVSSLDESVFAVSYRLLLLVISKRINGMLLPSLRSSFAKVGWALALIRYR